MNERPSAPVYRIEKPTLDAMLDEVAERREGATMRFHSAKDSITIGELASESRRFASSLKQHGVRSGDPIGVVLPSCRDFLISFFGALRAGAVPSPLALPHAFRSADLFYERVASILDVAQMRYLVGRRSILAEEPERVPEGVRILDPQELLDGAVATDLPSPKPTDLGLLQFTSGSTSNPKGVALAHENVIAGMNAIIAGIGLNRDDVNGQWIPLYHDMGLIGMLCGVAASVDHHIWSPRAFFRNPAGWLSKFSDVGATIYAGPSFSYEAMLSSVSEDDVSELDLSRWRVAFNGSEPIDPRVVDAFLERFKPTGFRPQTMYAVYGLAEVTLAATFPERDAVPESIAIDRRRLTDGEVVEVEPDDPAATRIMALGRPVEGIEMQITSDTGECLPEQRVGEVNLRGPSTMRGYYRNSEATDRTFREGWLRTGDLGFVRDGQLYLTGRAKEMIIVRGSNIYPVDVEAMVRDRLGALTRGGCVAFAADDRIVVLFECRPKDVDAVFAELDRVHGGLVTQLGVDVVDLIPVKTMTIERTTSGKQQRLAMKRRFLQGELGSAMWVRNNDLSEK